MAPKMKLFVDQDGDIEMDRHNFDSKPIVSTDEMSFFDQDVQGAIKDARDVVNKALQGLSEATPISHIPEIQHLKTTAQNLAKWSTDETTKIGIVGPSGHGKSSLINALLNIMEISPTNASGGAVTSIVTEFRQESPDQIAPILIEYERFSNDEISETIANPYRTIAVCGSWKTKTWMKDLRKLPI